ncbi:MAG TPA: HAMP domain-containing sensor histidine kinase [Salinimicrobium sp.]|nr:HAMP domain-containing sensor histidine kinase [Salinimicrobium sp.]
MKLLNYTSSYFAAILLLLMAVWGMVFYFEMISEINDSLDDGLANQKILVIQKARQDPTILNKNSFGNGYYTIKQIDEQQAVRFKDSYRDTLMYMQNEEDYEPVRLLETVFEQDGSFYKMKLTTSMVEEDDLIQNLLVSLIFLYAGLIISILVLNNLILKKVWSPFYRLLGQLKSFSIEKEENVDFQNTKIEEFSLLNKNIEKLLQKSKASYKSQKQFIENAAHELQTPLAISRNQLELLIEKNRLKEEEMGTIAGVLENLERLSRFNKSLLLLSKIENKQYLDEKIISVNGLIEQLTDDFEDLAAYRDITIKIQENEPLEFKMNKDLSNILFGNLIKNAILHGKENAVIKIEITKKEVSISNSGGKALEKDKIFERFYKHGSAKGSTGLGLAIAQAISRKYNLQLSYHFQERHVFKVLFP